MNTDIAPATAQPKTLAQRIEETHRLERQLWEECDKLEKDMEPYKVKFEASRSKWADAYNRLDFLRQMQKEQEGSV